MMLLREAFDIREWQVRLANRHARAGRFGVAEGTYRKLLARHPYQKSALAGLGRLLLRERRFEEAVVIWQRAVEIEPHNQGSAFQLARALHRSGRIEAAAVQYLYVVTLAPLHEKAFAALEQMSDRLARSGSGIAVAVEGAAAKAQQLLELQPDSALIHGRTLSLLATISSRSDPNAAVEYWAQLAALNTQSIEPLMQMARIRERQQRNGEALVIYQNVLALDPVNANALLYRGRLLRQLGRIEEAIDEWRQVCERTPKNAAAWHELIFMLASAERDAEALAALDAAEAALPVSPAQWMRLGLAAQAANFLDRAIAYFERAIEAEPHEAGHRARLGQLYFRQGVVDGAFHHLLAANKLKPADMTIAKHLADTVHTLNAIGIDHVDLHKAQQRQGEVLVPECLFRLVREIADRRIVPYEPVPRRVIAVSASLAAGGAERQLVNLLRGLSEPAFDLDLALFCLSLARRTHRDFFLPLLAGTSVNVVTPDKDAIEICLNAAESVPYAQLIRSFPADMAGPIAFWLGEFRRRRPQVVHAWQDNTNLTAVVAALLAGVPRIVLSTRSMRPDNPRRRLKRFMREGYQAVLGHPSVVLSNNSRAGADDYAAWLGIDPATVKVVHNGIDFERLAQSVDFSRARQLRDNLGVPPDAPVIGSVFRMTGEKRPLLWVEVAAEVARQDPRAHFIVCGDGPMRTDMLNLAARLGIADRLHLLGLQDDIGSYYKAMDVVLLTSRHEGLPNVLLEAQSLGVPVVAPDVGGVSETVWQGVTGWTVREADAHALAERALTCLTNSAWAARARAEAPSFVRERFGIAAMLHRTLDVYGLPNSRRAA